MWRSNWGSSSQWLLFGSLPDGGPAGAPSRSFERVARHNGIVVVRAAPRTGAAVMTRPDGLPIFLTAAEAASVLRTTPKAIYVMVERRQLPGVTRIGRRLLVRTELL